MFRKPEVFLALLSGHVSRLHVVENWRSRQLSHAFKFLFAAPPPPWPFSSFQREHLQLRYKHGHPAPTFTIIEHDGKRGRHLTPCSVSSKSDLESDPNTTLSKFIVDPTPEQHIPRHSSFFVLWSNVLRTTRFSKE